MEPVRELGKSLLVLGALLFVIGGFLFAGGRIPFRLGRLPGDIVYESKSTSFYFPVATCILISVAVTLFAWAIAQSRK